MSSAEYSCKLFKPSFAYRQTVWTQIRQCSTIHLILKTPSKPASQNVVYLCRLLNILANFSNLVLHTGKQCGPRSDSASTIHLILKTPRKPASENVVCLCRLLHIFLQTFQTYFCIQANSVDPDQTVLLLFT